MTFTLSWTINDQKDPSVDTVGTMKVVPNGEDATISSSSLLSVKIRLLP